MMLDHPASVRRSFHAPAQPAEALPPQQHYRPLSFGPFRLDPAQRSLTEGGKPLPLGGRAFDVLMALVERRGSIVSKDELMECVWPGRIVEENTLHAQISLLRRACISNRDLIKTVAGRGYQFTGEIEEADDLAAMTAAPVPVAMHMPATPSNLPTPVSELIGRAREIVEIAGLLAQHRLVSLVGPGGVGKSRLGLAAAHHLLPNFPGGAWIVDLATLTDGNKIADAIGGIFGLPALAFAHKHAVEEAGGKPALLVLDNCEHVIDAASHAAETLLQANGALRVMVTSREALRAEGERLFQVPALEMPDESWVGGDMVLQHAAVRLFMDRVKAAGLDLPADRHSAASVGEICRRLEGNPLAIELAASRAATIGVDELAQRLEDRLRLLTGGRRLAAPRHQSLRASMEWSYGLLTERERIVLRRLAVFSGSFTLESARAIATGPGVSMPDVDECVMSLIEKSLMMADVRGSAALYGLSETTQLFAREKLAESGHAERGARGSVETGKDASPCGDAQPNRRVNVVTRLTFGGQSRGTKLPGSFGINPMESDLVAS